MIKYFFALITTVILLSCEGSKQNPQIPAEQKKNLYRLGKVDIDSTVNYHPMYIQK